MNQAEKMDLEGYNEIGMLLRVAREQTQLPIDQVARLLHIRMRYLDALEQGRLHELPGLTYTRGYLQAYASFLGLDKDEVLRRFEDVESVLARKNIYFPQVFSKEKAPTRWVVWGGLAVMLLVYVGWSLVGHPASPRVSMVEKIPLPAEVAQAASMAFKNEDVVCLQEQEVLYPPCTAGKNPDVEWFLSHSELKAMIQEITAESAAVENAATEAGTNASEPAVSDVEQ